jgi:O-antigen biosynthesis protein
VRERSAKIARLLPGRNDHADRLAGAREREAAALRDALIEWTSATRYGLRIGVTSWDVIDRWGDYHFARGLQRSLERAGHPTRLHFLRDWTSHVAARDDVAVHLFGLKEAPTHPGQVNLLWHISHPDLATRELYDRYDHAFVASDRFADTMAEQAEVPVTALHQATDPERFRPMPGGPHHELLFVGSSRKVHRRIVDDLAGTSHDLAIYGRDWTPDLAEPRFVKGEGVQNAELARYNSAADIVLNDHWDDMRIEGFISNRVYDALACESFVISDHLPDIGPEFEGAVPTYRTRAELETLIARYLDDPAERHRLAARGRAIVLGRHTFDHRVESILAVAEPLVAARREASGGWGGRAVPPDETGPEAPRAESLVGS